MSDPPSEDRSPLEGFAFNDKMFTWAAGPRSGGIWLLLDGPRGLRPASEAEIELATALLVANGEAIAR